MKQSLKLAAADEEGLAVLSSLIQDAVVDPQDLHFDPEHRRFTMMASRFMWEREKRGLSRLFSGQSGLRIRTALVAETVSRVATMDFPPRAPGQTPLSLLSLTGGTSGFLLFTFSGGAQIKLTAAAVQLYLSDQSEPWPARRRPKHHLSAHGLAQPQGQQLVEKERQ